MQTLQYVNSLDTLSLNVTGAFCFFMYDKKNI